MTLLRSAMASPNKGFSAPGADLPSPGVSDETRQQVLRAVRRTIDALLPRESHPALVAAGNPRSVRSFPGGLRDLDRHVDALIDIVRRSTAGRIEPYLAQILEEICPTCQYQCPSGYCPLR